MIRLERGGFLNRLEKAVVFGMLFAMIFSSITAFADDVSSIKNSVLRLHILANSDSEEDQNLKIKVRDQILSESDDLFYQASDKNNLIALAKSNQEKIAEAAKKVIRANGFDYEVKVEVCNMFFDQREYDNLTLPSGNYDAVRVVIGSGNGKNWWCIMFPPLCVPAATERSVEETFSEDEQKILKDNDGYQIKFAILELFDAIKSAIDRLFLSVDLK